VNGFVPLTGYIGHLGSQKAGLKPNTIFQPVMALKASAGTDSVHWQWTQSTGSGQDEDGLEENTHAADPPIFRLKEIRI
jgi:hypothetical protein